MRALMTPAKPEAVTQFNLECGGKTVGRIELDEKLGDYRYRVIINAGASEGGGLYQGHGATPESAIQQLLERHERFATAQLRRISELRELLLSEAP